MQSLNNLSPRGRQILIGVIALFVLAPLFYFLYGATSNSDPSKKGTYYDKGSGETVTNNNQTPETYGTANGNQTYLGVAELLDFGITKYQVDALKSALTTYGKTRTPQASEYSINTKTIAVVNREAELDDTTDIVSFEVLINRKDTYKATMRYFDLSSIQLTLVERDGDPVYTSSSIDGSKLKATE